MFIESQLFFKNFKVRNVDNISVLKIHSRAWWNGRLVRTSGYRAGGRGSIPGVNGVRWERRVVELEIEIEVPVATVIYVGLNLQWNEPDIDPLERFDRMQKYCKTSQHTINAMKN